MQNTLAERHTYAEFPGGRTERLAERSSSIGPVAFVAPGWPPDTCSNGIVSWIAALRPAMRALGARPLVLTCASGAPSAPDDDVVDLRLEAWRRKPLTRICERTLGRRQPQRWHAKLCAIAIRHELRRLQPRASLQLLQVEDSFGLAGFVARRCPLPVVTRLHGPWFLVGDALGAREDRDFHRRIADERQALSRVAGVTAPSHDVLARVRSYYGQALANAAVIPNPVPSVDAAQGWRADACERGRILFVGRFDRAKGADLIVAAFTQLLVTHPALYLTLVGPDSGFLDRDGRCWHSREFMERGVLRPSHCQRIEYLGFQSPAQIAALRRKAQMTVVCSRYETFGNVAAEAMAAGCPLIATAVGGLREIVQDGRNGLLCQPDDPEDLARKIVLLLRDPELGARLGKRAAHDAEQRYAPEVIARQMLDYYRAVLARVRTQSCETAQVRTGA